MDLATLIAILEHGKLQNAIVLPNGRVHLVHQHGSTCFANVRDLLSYLTTGQLPSTAVSKFKESPVKPS